MDHLTPPERGLVQQTTFTVADEPTPAQSGDFPPGGYLLGLYSSPPPTVTVFEGEARRAAAAGVIPPDPIPDIVRHEVGHVVGYTHADPSDGSQAARCACGSVPNGTTLPCDCGAMYLMAK
jgi:hypothetical protein